MTKSFGCLGNNIMQILNWLTNLSLYKQENFPANLI